MTDPDANTPDPRAVLRRLFDAAVAAAQPALCLPPHLPPTPKGRTIVIGAGKARCALEHDVGVIVCVGETLEEREQGRAEEVLARQVAALASLAGAGAERFVVAYEPVWAIGTGRTATPEQAQSMHEFIRGRLAGAGFADSARLRLLYGGSVKPANAASLFGMADIDGGLIGGAALVADDFGAICRSAAGA